MVVNAGWRDDCDPQCWRSIRSRFNREWAISASAGLSPPLFLQQSQLTSDRAARAGGSRFVQQALCAGLAFLLLDPVRNNTPQKEGNHPRPCKRCSNDQAGYLRRVVLRECMGGQVVG